MDTLSHARREWLPTYLIAITVTTTVLLCLRIISRFQWRGGRLGLDDLFIVIGWCFSTAGTGVSIQAAMHYRFDRHVWDVSLGVAVDAIEYAWIISLLYIMSTSFTKLSILLFYRRLVRGIVTPRFRWAIWCGITIIILYTLIIFGLVIASCTPVSALWMRYDATYAATQDFHCASQTQITSTAYASGIMSVLTDAYSVLLPGLLFMQIKITRRQRIGMMSVFAIGFLVVIAGIFRTVYLVKAEGAEIDKTWNTFNVIIAGKTEGDFGIICACAPSLKSIFRHYFRDQNTTSGSRSKGSDGTGASRANQSTTIVERKVPWEELHMKNHIEVSEEDEYDDEERPRTAETHTVGFAASRYSSGREARTRELTTLDDESDVLENYMAVPEPAILREGAQNTLHPLHGNPAPLQSWLSLEHSEGDSGDEMNSAWRER